MTGKRIVAMGEPLVEVMRPAGGRPLSQTGTFAGPFASGAPAIFAVAAARLGGEVEFVGVVGDDPFGELIIRRLQAEGVRHERLRRVPAPATGVAFVAYDPDGNRSFLFHAGNAAPALLAAEDVAEIDFEEVAFLHISGSTLMLGESAYGACIAAVERATAAGTRITFDPNMRPELDDGTFLERCRPVLAHTDVLLPGEAEVQFLAGERDPEAACRTLLSAGVPLIALKRGARGSLLCTPEQMISVPPLPVTEVDPTGAGDVFCAAFVVALQAGFAPERAARFANGAGALSVQELGPMEGLPDRARVARHVEDMREGEKESE